jgi:ribosomal protein S18 acetylase RimI-like enzyme
MEKACSDPAHHVWVAERHAEPIGYIACQRKDDALARIQLVGVDPAFHGQGIGQQLMRTALNYFGQEATRLEVVTQGRNLAALRLYAKHGFVTATQELWYHWWSEKARAANPSRMAP